MKNENLPKESFVRKVDFHQGEKVLYKGEEAIVLHVEPVFVVKLLCMNKVVCGNVLEDVRPCRSSI
jgi:hypothetical protein